TRVAAWRSSSSTGSGRPGAGSNVAWLDLGTSARNCFPRAARSATDGARESAAARRPTPARASAGRAVTRATAIGSGASRRGRADRHAEQRHEEDEADQAAPQSAAGRPDTGQRRLVQLDLPVAPALHDHEVVDLDDARLLRLSDVAGHTLGGGEIVIRDRYQ